MPLAGAGTPELVYEVVPDSSAPTVNTRVCRAEVTSIGSNLPCVEAHANYQVDQSITNRSDVSKTVDDFAVLNIGSTCPSGAASNDPDANKFIVTGCIELLRQQTDTTAGAKS